MKSLSLGILAAVLALPASANAQQATPVSGAEALDQPSQQASMARWVCKKADHVCGLDDARILSNPAKLDYQTALDATPSMKELKRKGIDPNSPEGIQLRTKGQDELKKAAKSVMESYGHCSVWKKIRNTDGRSVSSITQQVKDKLGQG